MRRSTAASLLQGPATAVAAGGLGSRAHPACLPQQPFDKRAFSAVGSAGSPILWNFLRATFLGRRSSLDRTGSSTRTWPGRSAGARDPRRGRSQSSPATPPLCLPLPRRDVLAGRDAGGPSNLEYVCPLARAPPPARAPSAPNPGRPPLRAGCFQPLLSGGSPLHPASASAPESDKQKWFSATHAPGGSN